MQTCFEILGVSPSATQKELKRAYFSQVRIHSPEKDPDAFKKIRTAYEQATEALEMDLPVFPTSDNPKEFEYEKSLLFALEKREFENYYSKLNKANQLFPNNPLFLYHKSRMMRARNTNAIRIAEKLVKMDPENRHYQMELALCYIAQRWDKRAETLCDKLVKGGVRNTEFLRGYIPFLKGRNDYERIYTILYKVISENECQNPKYLSELTDLVLDLIAAAAELGDKSRQEAAAGALTDFIQNNLNLLGDKPLVGICQKLTKKISEVSPDHRQFVRDTLYDLQNLSKDRTENRQVASIVDSDKLQQIRSDKRLPRCAEILYLAYVQTPAYHPNAVKMDARLCGIMEREKLLACRPILKKEYPIFHDRIVTFLRAISTEEKAKKLKEDLLSKYEEYEASYFPDRKRYFYELYPDEKPDWMDDDEEEDEEDFFGNYFYDDDDDDDDLDAILRRLFRQRGFRGFPF